MSTNILNNGVHIAFANHYREYKLIKDNTFTIDNFQTRYSCCGIEYYYDWYYLSYSLKYDEEIKTPSKYQNRRKKRQKKDENKINNKPRHHLDEAIRELKLSDIVYHPNYTPSYDLLHVQSIYLGYKNKTATIAPSCCSIQSYFPCLTNFENNRNKSILDIKIFEMERFYTIKNKYKITLPSQA